MASQFVGDDLAAAAYELQEVVFKAVDALRIVLAVEDVVERDLTAESTSEQ
jgi:hypothetical protein